MVVRYKSTIYFSITWGTTPNNLKPRYQDLIAPYQLLYSDILPFGVNIGRCGVAITRSVSPSPRAHAVPPQKREREKWKNGKTLCPQIDIKMSEGLDVRGRKEMEDALSSNRHKDVWRSRCTWKEEWERYTSPPDGAPVHLQYTMINLPVCASTVVSTFEHKLDSRLMND